MDMKTTLTILMLLVCFWTNAAAAESIASAGFETTVSVVNPIDAAEYTATAPWLTPSNLKLAPSMRSNTLQASSAPIENPATSPVPHWILPLLLLGLGVLVWLISRSQRHG
jgi:hypothetical protein